MLISAVQVQGLSALMTQVSTLVTNQGTDATNIAALQTSLSTLSGSLDSLKGKSIKDVVRVTYDATYANSSWTATTTQDTTTLTKKTYPVYLEDNRPVYKQDGTQLYFDLNTNTFTGTPSTLDVQNSTKTTKAFTPITTDFVFKIFPEGTWTLETLPESALLDNQELAALSYDIALNNVVVNLAKDEDLINQIKALVGETAISTQLAGKVDKTSIVDSTVDTSAAGYTASDEKVLSEAAVLAKLSALSTSIQSAIAANTSFLRKDSLVNEVKNTGGSTETTINEATLVSKFSSVDTAISNLSSGVTADVQNAQLRTFTQNVSGDTPVTSISILGPTVTSVLYLTVNGVAYTAADGFSVSGNTITLSLPFDITGSVTDKVVVYFYGSVQS